MVRTRRSRAHLCTYGAPGVPHFAAHTRAKKSGLGKGWIYLYHDPPLAHAPHDASGVPSASWVMCQVPRNARVGRHTKQHYGDKESQYTTCHKKYSTGFGSYYLSLS